MTLPYCCHIISQIEIEYNSSSDLPKWLVQAFKNPRVSNNILNFKDKKTDSSKNHDLKELYSICDSFLQKFGYSMKHLHYYDPQADEPLVSLPISDAIVPYDDSSAKDLSSQCSSSSDSEVDFTNSCKLMDSDSQGISRSLLQSMINKTMVYYLSLYDEFSKNNEFLNISKKSFSISKNSTYEMISGLRDCISQLYESNDPENEAIIITNDYSGIFSSNDILITRSNMNFRDQIRSKGISYLTIYDEIKSYSKHSPLISKADNDFSELVSSYLNNKYKTDMKRRKTYNSNYIPESMSSTTVSKLYMLKSLKLPFSEEYDLNIIRIMGRSNCHKLFKMIDKSCMNSLLEMKNDKISKVRLILTNFPTLFSKVNQARVSFLNEEGLSKITIRGLIMPSVLMRSFNIVKVLESNTLMANPTIKIKYNQVFDSEMYEKTLRISDNRIYDQFINNFGRIKNKYKYSYKALKKLVPFNRFTMKNGKVTVIPSSTPLLTLTKEEIKLRLENHTHSVQNTELATQEQFNSCKIVIVKDTLYFSLSKINLYLNNIEGSTPVKNHSTKSFLDDSLRLVSHLNLRDITCNDDFKCYLELYPNKHTSNYRSNSDATLNSIVDNEFVLKDGGRNFTKQEHIVGGRSSGHISNRNSDSNYSSKANDEKVECVLAYVSPHNLVSVIWILSYLLHRSGHTVLLDQKCVKNITGFDIHSLNVLENPLKNERDLGKLDLLNTVNYPLSQQSYFIHLVNHINFNKDFYKTFKVKYNDYLNNPNTVEISLEPEKPEVIDQVLNLTTGWKTYFKHKSKKVSNVEKDKEKENKENKEKRREFDKDKDNKVEELDNISTTSSTTDSNSTNTSNDNNDNLKRPLMRNSSWSKRFKTNVTNGDDNSSSTSTDSTTYSNESRTISNTTIIDNNNTTRTTTTTNYNSNSSNNKTDTIRNTDKSNKGSKTDTLKADSLLTDTSNKTDTIYDETYSQSSMSVSSSYNVDFGTVYTSSRKHGRVHQCQFDFDTSSMFGEMFYNDNFNIIDEFNSMINKSMNIESKRPTHFIIVFIYSNEPTINEVVNYTMIRNVIKSNLVKLSPNGVEYNSLDLDKPNQVNVNKFRNLFTSNDFSSGSEIKMKNGIGYSLLSSDFSLNEFYNILNQVERTTNIKMIGVPLMDEDIHCFTKSSMKLIKVQNMVKNDNFNSTLEFINISWIYDSYFEGIMNLDKIPEEYVLDYTLESSSQYSLDDFSIQDFKEDGSSQLRFSLDDLNEFGSTQVKFYSQESNYNNLSQMNTSLEYYKQDTLSQFSYSVETLVDRSEEVKLPIEDIVKREEKQQYKEQKEEKENTEEENDKGKEKLEEYKQPGQLKDTNQIIQTTHTIETTQLMNTTHNRQSLDTTHTTHSTNTLMFKDSYKNIKYFWGWTLYIVNECGNNISNDDCTLYRKYCGIIVKKYDKIVEIKKDVENNVIDKLSKFNITSSDVEEYLSNDKIYLNSVVISTMCSELDSENIINYNNFNNNNTNNSNNNNENNNRSYNYYNDNYKNILLSGNKSNVRCIYPTIKNKRICFGGYEGIPILSHKWFLKLLNSSMNNLKTS